MNRIFKILIFISFTLNFEIQLGYAGGVLSSQSSKDPNLERLKKLSKQSQCSKVNEYHSQQICIGSFVALMGHDPKLCLALENFKGVGSPSPFQDGSYKIATSVCHAMVLGLNAKRNKFIACQPVYYLNLGLLEHQYCNLMVRYRHRMNCQKSNSKESSNILNLKDNKIPNLCEALEQGLNRGECQKFSFDGDVMSEIFFYKSEARAVCLAMKSIPDDHKEFLMQKWQAEKDAKIAESEPFGIAEREEVRGLSSKYFKIVIEGGNQQTSGKICKQRIK